MNGDSIEAAGQPDADVPPPLPPASVAAPPPQPFAFTGNGREYFQIWIVNVFFSAVTLGVYSAWAKVRRMQYFYRNTRVAGASFDYHGTPIAILKGRIVAAVLLAAYYAAGLAGPVPQLGALGLGLVIFPFLFCRSLRFRLYNSSYRGLRFSFAGTAGEAYVVLLWEPLLVAASLFVLTPWWHLRLKRYQHGRAAFGGTPFSFTAPVGAFYGVYLRAAALLVGVLMLLILALIVLVALAVAGGNPTSFAEPPVALGIGVGAIYLTGAVAVQALFRAGMQNVVWNHTRLGPHGFVSRVRPLPLFRILFTNLIATVLTLGLFKPFADVRLARYYAEQFAILPAGSLDDFSIGAVQGVAATGEEMLDIFDIDVAF